MDLSYNKELQGRFGCTGDYMPPNSKVILFMVL